jgi:fructoselysine-6-P-deglycase FrlB-like protein
MWRETGLWADVRELPASLAATIDAHDGVAETAALLSDGDVRRVVASGNGAAYYVALSLWLASLRGPAGGPQVVAVPSGLLASGWFRFRPGDRLLAVSSSGEFRDLVRALEAGAPRPYAAVTATAGSTIERGAGARVLQRVLGQRAVTHTQALAGATVCALAVWAKLSGDETLADAVAGAPEAASRAFDDAEAFAASMEPLAVPPAAVAFGSDAGWPAALEAALLLKEVARVPCEGAEAREGATSSMFGLAEGHLAVSLPLGDDPALAEAERLCAAAGASVVRCPGGALADPRLALVATLPAACALAARLALEAGHDPDQPAWTHAYYSTARA